MALSTSANSLGCAPQGCSTGGLSSLITVRRGKMRCRRSTALTTRAKAARSIERWFPKMFGVDISARQVQAYWVYEEQWVARRREAGKPFTNHTGSVQNPSQVAIDLAEFLAGKGVPVNASQLQALWNHHRAWQSSPERRAERGEIKGEDLKEEPTHAGRSVVNQPEVRSDDGGHDDVDVHRYPSIRGWTRHSRAGVDDTTPTRLRRARLWLAEPPWWIPQVLS